MKRSHIVLLVCSVLIIAFSISAALGDQEHYFEADSTEKKLLKEPFKSIAEDWEGVVYLNIYVFDGENEATYEISSNPPKPDDPKIFSSKKVFLLKD